MKINKKKQKQKKMTVVQKQKTRQELRKIQRKEKKARKDQFYKNKSTNKQQQQHKQQGEIKNSLLDSKRIKKVSFKDEQTKKTSKSNPPGTSMNENLTLLKTQENKLEKEMNKQRIKQLKVANQTEDKLIKKLEKRFKVKKRKSKSVPQSFAADGLDYLLEACDSEKFKSENAFGEEENFEEESSSSEFENDQIKGRTKRIKLNENIEDEMKNELNEEDEEDENEEMEEKEEEDASEEMEDEDEEEEEEEEMEEKIVSDEEHNDNVKDDDEDKEEKEELWEDIYGRTRDAKGTILSGKGGKYMPPQKREIVEAENKNEKENLKRIERQLKGLLNRLSENNLKSIANEIEEIYQSNSRHAINWTLINLLLNSLVAPTFTPERLIMEHCMLIALLHAHVGAEIGAQILQDFVKKFHQEYNKHVKRELEGKELVNLLLVIAYMYNFKIFNSLLIYDILNLLANGFQEKDIELILSVLKSVGFALRKDDPIALKKLILNLQSKANETKGDTSRCQFMLDILLAIKNNNMTKIPNYDPTHLEHLKKLMKSLLRKGMFVTELKISLQDLLQAEERGRWWVVGSAWHGGTLQKAEGATPSPSPSATNVNVNVNEFSQKLLQLARKQRMNSDTRRNIFCILMSAQDYIEAYEKLMHLGLKNQQERDIIYVLVHCSLHERKFNPYYAFIAHQLCLYDRRFQLTLQYTLWDKLKQLSNFNKNQISNLASFIQHLILERALPLSALKAVEFAQMNKSLLTFLRQLFIGLLIERTEEDCTAIFEKVSLIPKLKHFRDGLKLFLNYFLLNKIDQVQNANLLQKRIHLINKMFDKAEHQREIL